MVDWFLHFTGDALRMVNRVLENLPELRGVVHYLLRAFEKKRLHLNPATKPNMCSYDAFTPRRLLLNIS